MLKTIFKYGVIGGAAVCLYVFTLTYSGAVFSNGPAQYLGYLAIVIMPLCTFLALKEMRDKAADKKLTLANALVAGLLLSLIAACLYCAVTWVEYEVFDNPYRRKLIDATRQEMTAAGKPETEIEHRIGMLNAHYDSFKPYVNTVVWYLGLGTLYTLVSFLLLRYFLKPHNP